MVSHWSLRDSKSLLVSRTLLGILADLNKAVFWIVSTRPLISKSSSPYSNHLVTVPREPITIGITATFMFNSFFNSQAWSRYLSLFSLSFNFTLWSTKTAKSTISLFLYFLSFFFCRFWVVHIPFVRIVKFHNYHYFYTLKIFHISVSWWSFTGFWITSLPKSPGLFSVCCSLDCLNSSSYFEVL